MSAKISSSQGEELTTLVGEQSSDTSELASLEQSVQQNQLASIGVTSGSRIVTPGTLVPASSAKIFGLDGIAGLIGGLVIGVAYVAVQAVVSVRLRRRDEVASLLGAPVELSLMPVRHPRMRQKSWIRKSAFGSARRGKCARWVSASTRGTPRRPNDAAHGRCGRRDRPGGSPGGARQAAGRGGRIRSGSRSHERKPPGPEHGGISGSTVRRWQIGRAAACTCSCHRQTT